eukprot:CAMPEP_0115603832 /NCGR_PEP_ID=MMETSP0272-20121206/16632_1 /TAXON_ID=71861 /ORGANISM="Scrippsiella trochoidea, Strain CCMP3099" /LENGTH=61 /DNA_ID=CAMNT_0003039369 /DNA_START=298 /DNA_END=481 /DNA_ORIENTATION=-
MTIPETPSALFDRGKTLEESLVSTFGRLRARDATLLATCGEAARGGGGPPMCSGELAERGS